MRVVTKRLTLESRGVRFKIALYLSYLYIKFDYEIKGNVFEFQASRFGFIFSQMRQLMRLGTNIYSNERTCDK